MDIRELLRFLIPSTIISAVVLIAMFAAGIFKGKTIADNLTGDDTQPMQRIYGRILEKNTETRHEEAFFSFDYTVEWIVFEESNGVRRRVRNTKPMEIIIAVGDSGYLLIRGRTIYGFEKNYSGKNA